MLLFSFRIWFQPPPCIITCRFSVLVDNCWPPFADTMLGQDRMVELRAIARSHKLATGSQTIPNSVAEIAAAQGQSPPVGPPVAAALPAPQRKKLPLKKAKRKAPRVVSDEEADKSTEDGLICKRKRVAVTEPPAIESAAPNFIENPPAPPHHSSPLGTFSFQTPQLLKALLSNLLIRKPPIQPPKNSLPHHHASKLPPQFNLLRVVVSTNLRLLQQP